MNALEFDPDNENKAVRVTYLNQVGVMNWSDGKGIGYGRTNDGSFKSYIYFGDGVKAFVGGWIVREAGEIDSGLMIFTRKTYSGFKIYKDEKYRERFSPKDR